MRLKNSKFDEITKKFIVKPNQMFRPRIVKKGLELENIKRLKAKQLF